LLLGLKIFEAPNVGDIDRSAVKPHSRPTDVKRRLSALNAAHVHPKRAEKRAVFSDETFRRAAAIFRAMGEVARLKLLARLADDEWCVSELAAAANAGISTVSQQLRLLRSRNLVERRPSGKHVYYSLADRHVIKMVTNALEHIAESKPPRVRR
jgi:ArsR family transcriptional regulator, lead/cadmium/zinc/bismuth-responsive transcriptional repressor